MNSRCLLIAGVFAAGLLQATGAAAQTPASRIDGSPDEPGVRKPLAFPERAPQVDIRTPDSGVRVTPGAPAHTIHIQRVQIEGVQGFTAAELQDEFADIVGKPVQMPAITAAVNRIAKRYEAAGYVFYNVLLPQQDFASGTLRLVVIEGFIGDIVLSDSIKSETLRRRILAIAGKLANRRPLRRRDLERYLLLIGDIPGVTMKVALQPSGTDAGALTLNIDATLRRFEGIAGIDNYQSVPGTGINVTVGAIANSVLGLGESTQFRYLFATPFDRLHLFDLRHSQLLNEEGTRLDLLFQHVRQRPELLVDRTRIDFTGESTFGRAQIRHPLIRSVKHNLTLFTAFDILRSHYDVAETGVPGDSLQALRLGAVYTSGVDALKGQWQVTGQFGWGLAVFNADVTSRFAGRENFMKFSGAVQRSQQIVPDIALVAKASGQYALNTLPISEVFSFGGREYGRGFNSFELVGDHGASVSMELRYDPSFLAFDRSLFDFHLYAFGDYGFVRSRRIENRVTLEEGASVGAGIRFKILDRGTAEIEGAKPLLGRVAALESNDHRWRVFFRVGVTY